MRNATHDSYEVVLNMLMPLPQNTLDATDLCVYKFFVWGMPTTKYTVKQKLCIFKNIYIQTSGLKKALSAGQLVTFQTIIFTLNKKKKMNIVIRILNFVFLLLNLTEWFFYLPILLPTGLCFIILFY